MEKTWYASKAKWSGILLALGGILTMGGEYLATGNFDFNAFTALFLGTGIFGVRDALK